MVNMLNYDKYIDKLTQILKEYNVCSSHGIEHAFTVMMNAKNCINLKNNSININYKDYILTDDEIDAILLAALLHDADDKKFFPNNKNYENLRSVLFDKTEDFINKVITMVDLVSSSKNGDNIPDFVKAKEWLLIPRYADRLEAIGLIGIERCYKYGKTSNNPLFVDTTPRPLTEIEIWDHATEERYKNYTGKSDSMMDHYYDKLLRLTVFPIRNAYLDLMCNKRRKPIINFVLYFSNKKNMTDEDVINFINNFSN